MRCVKNAYVEAIVADSSTDQQRPLCFILMPFGSKPDPTGRPNIDFNRVYEEAIKPAVEHAGMEPLRADEEKTGGIIHKPMFERLLLCEYAVADLTTANPNVFYELGVRHTARPCTTQPIFAKHQPIPFDVNFLRALPYDLGENNAFGTAQATALRDELGKRLRDLRDDSSPDTQPDSPIFQLLGEWRPDGIARLKTDIFREQVRVSREWKDQMALARATGGSQGLQTLRGIQARLGRLDTHEAGVVIDLMLSYRAVKGWNEMIALIETLPAAIRNQVMVREQLAFALNRRAEQKERPEQERATDRERALQILASVEEQQGPSSETCGLIGRIYKAQWNTTRAADPRGARGYLRRAIDAYRRGFEADPRDAYPGVNVLTLLDVRGEAEDKAERDRLLPVVKFGVERRLGGKSPDYWDYATMLEIAVLESDRSAADRRLEDALAAIAEVWQPETTADNLRLILEARSSRNEDAAWLGEIVAALDARAKP
jgi:hypothetical protein